MTDRIGGSTPPRPRSRVVLVAPDDTVLLLRRSTSEEWWPGWWDLPGGGVEDNEGPQEAAQRELLEEAGLSAQFTGREVAWWGTHCGGTAYEMEKPSGTLTINREHDEARWFKLEELPEHMMGGQLEAIQALFPDAKQEEPAADHNDSVDIRFDSTVLIGQNRIDYGEFKAPRRTTEGFITFDAWATRTGVLVYVNPDGTVRRELRLPEHVFDAASLATLPNKPVTDEHPPELITSLNASRYARGWTGARAYKEGNYVRTDLTIIDAPLIAKVDRGEAKQLSCGYGCDLVIQAGVWKGEAYDAIQTNIRYNHLAVVPRGRAGSEVRLRTDASELIDPDDHKENKSMTKINIDGVDYEVSEAVAAAYVAQRRNEDARKTKAEKLQEEMDAKQKEMDALKAEHDKMSAKKDAADAEVVRLTAERADNADAAAIQQKVDTRLSLQTRAAKMAPELKFDGLDNVALMKAALETAVPGIKLDGKSVEYIEARFDAQNDAAPAANPAAVVRKAAEAARQDGEKDPVKEAASKFNQDSKDAWQKPLGVHKGA